MEANKKRGHKTLKIIGTFKRPPHQLRAYRVRGDVGTLPQRGESIAAIKNIAAHYADRAVCVSRQRDNIRIYTEITKQTSFFTAEIYIRVITRAVEHTKPSPTNSLR